MDWGGIAQQREKQEATGAQATASQVSCLVGQAVLEGPKQSDWLTRVLEGVL